ncbi:MAG: hypothetical protein AAF611_10435 [Bacteroidota bacterium]
MKKKSIQKLKLQKASISNLQKAITGGTIAPTLFCQSVNICETRDFTRCFNEIVCQFYDTNGI